jgi:hypothetical protein
MENELADTVDDNLTIVTFATATEGNLSVNDVANLQDLDDIPIRQISDRGELSEHSDSQTLIDGAESESFFTSVGSNPQTTGSREIRTNMEITALRKKVYHLEMNMGTLLRKYNVLESEIAKIKNENPKAQVNVLNSLHMLKAFQNGATTYDLEVCKMI